MNSWSGYFARACANSASIVNPPVCGRFVASMAMMSHPTSCRPSTSRIVGVMYTGLSAKTRLVSPMMGSFTSRLMAAMSCGVFARMPHAPPNIAAYAMRPMIAELCKGSSSNA